MKKQKQPYSIQFLIITFLTLIIVLSFFSCKIGGSEEKIIQIPITTILSDNCDSREGQNIDMIVLHHTGSSENAYKIAFFFQNDDAQVSAHYIINRDGAIIRSVPDNLRAWHAGNSFFEGEENINHRSIGIELCNLGDNTETFYIEQIESLIKLMAMLSEKYNIPPSRFVRHRDVAVPAGRKLDTADNLNVDVIYSSVASFMITGILSVPEYNVDKGQFIENPRLYQVVKGDTWEYISWLIYDSPALADSLKAANPTRDLIPGNYLNIPENPFDY